MYLRYLATHHNEEKNSTEFGFFLAAEYLKKHATLSTEHRKKLEQEIHWFDHNLPIPEYYQDEKNRQKAKSATSWFKDSAKDMIRRMNELLGILEANNVQVERIHSKKLLGKLIYEDEFQVTVLPFREVAKKVK